MASAALSLISTLLPLVVEGGKFIYDKVTSDKPTEAVQEISDLKESANVAETDVKKVINDVKDQGENTGNEKIDKGVKRLAKSILMVRDRYELIKDQRKEARRDNNITNRIHPATHASQLDEMMQMQGDHPIGNINAANQAKIARELKPSNGGEVLQAKKIARKPRGKKKTPTAKEAKLLKQLKDGDISGAEYSRRLKKIIFKEEL